MPTPNPSASEVARLFVVEGMTCQSCANRLEKAIRRVPGVSDAHVSFALRSARVGGDVDADAVTGAIERAGFSGQLDDSSAQPLPPQETTGGRVWTAVLAAAMVMLEHVLMVTHVVHLPPIWGILWSMVALWAGRSFYVRALATARHGGADMNTLVALGTGVAFVASLVGVGFPGVVEHPELHSDAVAMILAVTLFGKYLETRARRGLESATDAILHVLPDEVEVLGPDGPRRAPTVDLRLGDEVILRMGEVAPVDGVVVAGAGSMDEAAMTGEAEWVVKKFDNAQTTRIFAGTKLMEGELRIRADGVGRQTALFGLAERVRMAQASRAPVARLADRVSAIMVPGVLAVAAGAAVAWWWAGPWAELGAQARVNMTLSVFVSVLVVACPCAMGLATPLALVVGIGLAAKRGVLFRSAESLERAAHVDVVVFDKTGTLTEGNVSAEMHVFDGQDDATVRRYAAILARASDHPVARAVAALCTEGGSPLSDRREGAAEGVETLPGLGVRGRVEGHEVALGRRSWLLTASEGDSDGRAASTVLTVDGKHAIDIVTHATIKSSATNMIRRLQGEGVSVMLLSGDAQGETARVAEALGIARWRGECVPDEKLHEIVELQKKGERVAMVGDGVNDAPSLAKADLSVAIGTGTAGAIATSDVAIASGDPERILDILRIARATLRIVKSNLIWAFGFNLLAIPIAAGALYPWTGWLLPPWLSAGAMACSSLFVVLNTLRLTRARTAER